MIPNQGEIGIQIIEKTEKTPIDKHGVDKLTAAYKTHILDWHKKYSTEKEEKAGQRAFWDTFAGIFDLEKEKIESLLATDPIGTGETIVMVILEDRLRKENPKLAESLTKLKYGALPDYRNPSK